MRRLARLGVAEERLRFARDLHDLMGHSLSVIVLKAELAGRLRATSPERVAQEIHDVERSQHFSLANREWAVALGQGLSGWSIRTLRLTGDRAADRHGQLAGRCVLQHEPWAPPAIPAGVPSTGILAAAPCALPARATSIDRHPVDGSRPLCEIARHCKVA